MKYFYVCKYCGASYEDTKPEVCEQCGAPTEDMEVNAYKESKDRAAEQNVKHMHNNDSVDTIGLWVTNGFNMADTIITGISKWISVHKSNLKALTYKSPVYYNQC